MSENLGNKTIQELLSINLDAHYGSLMGMYTDQMHRYASSLGANSSEAKEAVQEAFVRVYYVLRGCSSKKICNMNLEGYLYMAVRNCVKTKTKSRRKDGERPRTALSFSQLSSERDEGLPFDRTDEGEDGPETAYLKKEMREEIIALLGYLPDQRDRDILRARFFGDFTVQEIADGFSLAPSTVRRILERSFRTLRATFKIRQMKEAR